MKTPTSQEELDLTRQRREIEYKNASYKENILAIKAQITALSNNIVLKRAKLLELDSNISANNDLYFQLGDKLRKLDLWSANKKYYKLPTKG